MPPKAKQEKYLWSREASRVQSCGGGAWLRVFDHKGKSRMIPTSLAGIPVWDAFLVEVREADAECAERIEAELLAWATR